MLELLFEDVPLVEAIQCLLLGLGIVESAHFGDETQRIGARYFDCPADVACRIGY